MTTRQYQLRGALRSMDPTHDRGTPVMVNVDGNFKVLHDRLAALEQIINRMVIVEQRRLEAEKTDTSRQVIAGTLLTGGGPLTADVTLNVDEASINHNALTNYVAGQHRLLNDAGSATTELWSSSKIDGLFDGKQGAFTAVDSVTAGTGPSQGVNPQTATFIHVSTVANISDCITLDVTPAADSFYIVANDGANEMDIYPKSGVEINAEGTNLPAALAAGARAYFVYQTTNKWRMVVI